jgi:L-ascorbate metabolism protein UlaG (beta-lactamase superfamily)
MLTDAVLRGRVAHLRRHGPRPEAPAKVDAVLLSHLHCDHADRPSLRLLDRRARVLAPRGAGDWVRRAGFVHVAELAAGEEAEVGSVRLAAVPARHDPRRHPLGGARAQPIGFVLGGEHGIYFAGDTDLFEGMAQLAPLEAALLPVAGWGPKLGPGHLDPAAPRGPRRCCGPAWRCRSTGGPCGRAGSVPAAGSGIRRTRSPLSSPS